MSPMADIAMKFFEACEVGKGWGRARRTARRTHLSSAKRNPWQRSAPCRPTDWMQGLMMMLPDGRYDMKSFAIDELRNNVTAYAVFSGTQVGP